MYEYNATCLRVIDGDTVDCIIDLGFSIQHKVRVRLAGIDTPETRTRDLDEKKRGLKAKDRVVELINKNNSKFVIKTEYDRTCSKPETSLGGTSCPTLLDPMGQEIQSIDTSSIF